MATLGRLGATVAAIAVLAACSPAPADVLPSAIPTVPPTASAAPRPTEAEAVLGLNVPWAVGGLRYARDGTLEYHRGDWPPFHVVALRLWDTRTAWLNLEPANDQWEFVRLDRFIAKAHAHGTTDITLVLAGTPRWAASRVAESDAAWLGPGSASMPKQLDEWREFVSTVASRYAGVITAYEIGNEPNLSAFWTGGPVGYAAYVQTAAAAIRDVDPMASIVLGGPLVRGWGDLSAIDEWIAPAMNATRNGIDAVAVHLYPPAGGLDYVPALLSQVRARIDATTEGLPVWVTEVNVPGGAGLSGRAQGRAVIDLTHRIDDAGVDRVYWYAWTDLGPESLIPLWPGTAGARALGRLPGRTP